MFLKIRRAEKLFYRKDLFSKFKGSSSREEHKTDFSVLPTIELNLQVELTKKILQMTATEH
jgi:hypothetical protein